MEKEPKFIKEFSKEQAAEERKQTAQEIRSKRAKHFAEKRANTEKEGQLRERISEGERVLAEQLKKIKRLEDEIEKISASKLGELLNYFKLRKLRADAAVGQKTYEELKQQRDAALSESKAITEKLGSEKTPPALQETETMLRNFYKTQEKQWENSEYAKEDLIKYFSEEHLASLSLTDYALLLKRFPSEMVAHVTRQGVRDHLGHIYHTAGADSYANGFMRMLEDGRLRPPLGVYLAEKEKDKAIARFLRLSEFESREEALEHLESFVSLENQGEPGKYVDRMAIHFATEEVADCYYGSEQGNEIFIVYPSAYIASQYYFSGQLQEKGGGYWNDQWVWANEERGMDLNAGLVFIPAEIKVDKDTGSRYELDEQKNPVVNQELVNAIHKVVESPNFYDYATKAGKILGNFNQEWTDGHILKHNQGWREKLEPFRLKLEQEFGITDPKIQRSILDYEFLNGLQILKQLEAEGRDGGYPETVESLIKDSLRRRAILFVWAKDAIPAKDFWENYFSNHHDKRPSKIVYYKNNDPTLALWDWKKQQGLLKTAVGKDVGFRGLYNLRKDSRATAGIDRFRGIAEKVIEDYFDTEERRIGSGSRSGETVAEATSEGEVSGEGIARD